MKDFPKFIGIAMALALALCLIGCANSTGSEVQSQPEAQTEVTFTTAPIDANCPFVGYWSDELPGVSPATLYLTLSVDGTWTYTSSDTTDMFGEWTWDGVDTPHLSGKTA